MKKALIKGTKAGRRVTLGVVFVLFFAFDLDAQKKTAPVKKPAAKTAAAVNRPKVTQIDQAGLRTALTPNGKPLLVNFWATWCDPYREEFPDLVKLGVDYKDRIDLITVSLDDLAEIDRDVPKFLSQMKAEMPAYLLKVADENAVIASITPDWQGGLPFTILYNEKGGIAYFKQGKFKPDPLRAEIEKILAKPAVTESEINALPISLTERSAEDGTAEARRDIAAGLLKIKRYGLRPGVDNSAELKKLKEKYGIEISDSGCLMIGPAAYYEAYNRIMEAEIQQRFGPEIARNLP